MDKDSVFQVIVRTIREVVPDLEDRLILPQDQLKALGVASVERTEILALTLEALDLDVPIVKLFGPTNLGELTDLLLSKLGG